MSQRQKTQDELDLERMHTVEDEAGNVLSPPKRKDTVSDDALIYISQIKELQEKYEQKVLEAQEIEMAILGYSSMLETEMRGKKGH